MLCQLNSWTYIQIGQAGLSQRSYHVLHINIFGLQKKKKNMAAISQFPINSQQHYNSCILRPVPLQDAASRAEPALTFKNSCDHSALHNSYGQN